MSFVVDDLMSDCPAISRAAKAGELVYEVNHDVHFSNEKWNIDLAIGPPQGPAVPQAGGVFRKAPPSRIRLAIEAKAIMTKHTGARRNRRRDIGAFRDYMDNYEPQAIRGGITILNMAPTFRSTLSGKVNLHAHIDRTIRGTATIFRNVPLRNLGATQGTVDANCLLVIEYDGVDRASARLGSVPPAPKPNDPISYESFINRLCDAYAWRWMRGPVETVPPSNPTVRLPDED